MSDEKFSIELAGRSWTIARLPWRIVRVVQPKLLRHSRKLTEGDPSKALSRLDEHVLAEQIECIALAVSTVDPNVTAEFLDGLPLRSAAVLNAATQVLRACGLDAQPSADVAPETANPVESAAVA